MKIVQVIKRGHQGKADIVIAEHEGKTYQVSEKTQHKSRLKLQEMINEQSD